MLFNCKLATKLPHVVIKQDKKDMAVIRKNHNRKRMAQKKA